MRREFSGKPLNLLANWASKFEAEGRILQNSLLISLLPGNLPAETGSIQAASTTTQSRANRDFPWFDEYPRFCGAQSRLAVSAGKKDHFRGSSGPSVSGNPKTVSRERGKERSETRFACDRDRFAK